MKDFAVNRILLFPFLIDGELSASKMNRQLAPLEKLRSQKPLGIIQRDHFNRPHAIEPENFCFVDVGLHNLSIRQDVRFSADSLETHAMNCSLGEA